ncbi:MAG: hypothetical protein JF607_23955 [Burkholderiales bacterium]|jgi:hypothetical protein|nr:hypothetical protein [Burkholderiales bacterium]
MANKVTDEDVDEPSGKPEQSDEPKVSGQFSGNLQLEDVVVSGSFSGGPPPPQNPLPFQTYPEGAGVSADLNLKYRIGEVDGGGVGVPTVTSIPSSEADLSGPSAPQPLESVISSLPDGFGPGSAPTGSTVDHSAATMAAGSFRADGKSTVSFAGSSLRNVYVADFNNDDAATRRRADVLNVTADATAFAQIAASRTTRPPMAVGVFGSWGAGKSYFMDLVHAKVESIAANARDSGHQSEAGEAFHDKVIQIRFNAWHYAETNLWASLVGHIFQELSAATKPDLREDVFGKLSTARRLTLEASSVLIQARREERSAKEKFEQAKTSLSKAQARPIRTTNLFADMMVSAFRDVGNREVETAREELQAAASELGVGAVLTSTKELTREGVALLRHGVQARDMFWSMVKNMGSPLVVLLFIFATVAAPFLAVEVLHLLGSKFEQIRSWVSEGVISCLALAGVVTTWFKKAAGPMLVGIEKLKAAKARVDAEVAKNLSKFEKLVADNEAAVAKASAEVQAASDLLKATTAKVAEARQDLHGQSAAGRLINFVRDRAANGEYAKHLGLVSTIRKDFEELSNLVSGEGTVGRGASDEDLEAVRMQVEALVSSAVKDALLTAAEVEDLNSIAKNVDAAALPFERIVLYIDDVDRCTPAKVVEVMQAVHMLLAFRLFVVFVAVDVRWVGSSLAQQYKEMLKDINTTSPLTSASDYLEKIFQIPYWLPAVTPESSDGLVAMMLPRAADEPTPLVDLTQVLAPKDSFEPATAPNEDRFVPIKFTADEIELIQHFAVLLDSPRKVIRFTNVVRFLRARGGLSRSFGSDPDAVCILTQLAIATASPESYSLWLLVARAYSRETIEHLSKALNTGYLSRYPVVLTGLVLARQRLDAETPVDVLVSKGRIASRLCFASAIPDPDGKLYAAIKEQLDSGKVDIPLLDELKGVTLKAVSSNVPRR